MNQSGYGVINALSDIVFSPGRALDHIKEHTAWLWWPLLINLAVTMAAFIWFYQWVDFDWLVDQTIAQVPPADRADAEGAIRGFMSPGKSTLITALAIVVMTLLIYTIQSVYLNLVNKFASSENIGFGQWFSFSTWTAFVAVFGALGMFITMGLADNNLLREDQLAPLTMNALFLHAGPGDPWFAWGNSLSLINFWMLGLMTIGFSRWTGSGLLKSAIVVSLPWVLIFGVWAALI